MKQSELKKLVIAVVEKASKNIEHFEKSKDNPQVYEMLIMAKSRLEIAEAFLDALDNNAVLLRMEGKL